MTRQSACLALCLMCCPMAAVAAAVIGTVTLGEAGTRLLRGATWYKLAPGTPVEDGDIVASSDGAQVQIELAAGSILAVAGAGALYLSSSAKGTPLTVTLPAGWLKLAAKAPGARVRTGPFDATMAEGALVAHAQPGSAEMFVEAGGARLVELTPAGAPEATARDAKRGEYWARPPSGKFTTVPRAPKAFVDAMPRHFTDPLPALAGRIKSKPALVVDHEITFAEAEPWLAGRDRAVFERRFAIRLRDPAFRKAVEPSLARYPSWDRQLHPEKYLPKPPPVR